MSRACVLIVDDEPELADLLAEEFRDQGFDTRTAHNFENAMKVIAHEDLSVIVTDVRMPGGSGLDLLRAVKIDRPSLPVILITGFVDVSQGEAEEAGAAGVFTKPFDVCRLITLAQNAANRHTVA